MLRDGTAAADEAKAQYKQLGSCNEKIVWFHGDKVGICWGVDGGLRYDLVVFKWGLNGI